MKSFRKQSVSRNIYNVLINQTKSFGWNNLGNNYLGSNVVVVVLCDQKQWEHANFVTN